MTKAPLLLLLLLGPRFGCDEELCIGSDTPRCEGDIRAYCRGGWMGFGITVERENCRDTGKRCARHESSRDWADCTEVLGKCDAATFKPYCGTFQPDFLSGFMVHCVNGEQLGIGKHCFLPPGSASARRPQGAP